MAYIINPESHKLEATFVGRFERIDFAEFRDDDSIVALHQPRTVKVWDPDGTCRSTFTIEPEAARMALSPDGMRVAIATWDQTVEIREVETGRLTQRLTGFHQMVSCMDWTGQNDRLLSSTADGRIYVHRPSDGRCLVDIPVHSKSMCRLLKTSSDGKKASIAFSDGTVGVWDMEYYSQHIDGNAGFRRELWQQGADAPRHPDMNLTLIRTR